MKTQKKCVDCGVKVSQSFVKRCRPCRSKWAVGKNASHWKGGSCCLDCKVKISRVAKRCMSCSNKRLLGIENNPRALGKRWKLKKPRKRWSDEALKRKAKYMRKRWVNSEVKKEIGKKISKALIGRKLSPEHVAKMSGQNSYHWIIDRSKVSRNRRGDAGYMEWARAVKKRDKSCKLKDENCDGRIESHHILGWIDYPELRYKINNGIALCHAHHPRKRAEEKRLVPQFQELVSVSNELI